ncbi:MAG TPA: RING finger protein [Candidatus Methanoperedens sp.]
MARTLLTITLVFFLFTQVSTAVEFEPFFIKQVTNESIKSVSVSPYGKYIAAVSEDNFIHFFDKKGERIWDMKISGGRVSEVATNGKDIVLGVNYPGQMGRGHIILYSKSKDMIFDKIIEPVDNKSSSAVLHVAISGDGSIIVASGKDEVYILDKTGIMLSRITIKGSVTDVETSLDNEFGVVSFGDSVNLFSINGKIFRNFGIENNSINEISISDDGHIAVLTPQAIFLFEDDRKLWEKAAGKGNFFTSISISPTGDLVAAASTRDGLILFDRNGVEVLRYPVDFKYVSTDGRLVAGVKSTFLYLFNISSYTTGSISVLSTRGAEVYLDEKFKGTVPLTISGISAGTHTIKISKKDCETWVQEMDISYGDKKEISIMLVPSIPITTPLPAPDVVVIPKNAIYFTLLGAILAAVPAAAYFRKMKKKFILPVDAPFTHAVKINDTEYDSVVGSNCPYCGDLIKANSIITICPACDTPHHRECWEKHRGCTTFGCRGAP